MGDAFGNLGINGPFLLSQIVNVGILFIVLRVLLWKPLLQRLDERREMLEKEKTDAEALAEARANIQTERERALGQTREEAQKILAEAREQASTLTEQASREARQEAAEMVDEARNAAQEERNRILGELRGQISAMAIAAAQKIVGETLDERHQQSLVESFFSGIHEGRVEVLPEGVESRAGEPVSVTSAIPLTDDQQVTIQRDLASRLGEEGAINFHVDPRILGGLVVRVGDRVVDGSAAGQLERLHQSLT